MQLCVRSPMVLGSPSCTDDQCQLSLACPTVSYVSVGSHKRLKCFWSLLCQGCLSFIRKSGTAFYCEPPISYSDLDRTRKQWMGLTVLLTEDIYTQKNPVLWCS